MTQARSYLCVYGVMKGGPEPSFLDTRSSPGGEFNQVVESAVPNHPTPHSLVEPRIKNMHEGK